MNNKIHEFQYIKYRKNIVAKDDLDLIRYSQRKNEEVMILFIQIIRKDYDFLEKHRIYGQDPVFIQ